jgi:hypothetical protein
MTTLYNYRLFCETENDYVYKWDTVEPTTCPHNNSHTIDPNSISIDGQVSTEQIIVREERIPTGGNFQAMTMKLVVPGNSTGTIATHWPFHVTAFGVNFITTNDHKGDIMNMYAGKDATVGALGAPIAPAVAWTSQNYTVGQIVTYPHPVFGSRVYTCVVDTVSNEIPTNTTYWRHGFALTVSSTVLTYTQRGYDIKLVDLVNSHVEAVGRIISIDPALSRIYVETSPVFSYSPATPTYIQQTAYFIRNFEIGEAWNRNIGEMKIGGSHIPADTLIEVSYQNNSSTTKDVIGHVEFLY